MTPTCLIPVRCPHCKSSFAIDPALETASIGDVPDDVAAADSPVAYRPLCPGCGRRVPVRMADLPPDD